MLDGYADHYTEPSNHHFDAHQDGYDRSLLIELDPVLPELGPVEQGVRDAYDRTPDWTRASGCGVYRRSLIMTLIGMAGPGKGQMTNATGLSAEESWAMSGAPGDDEW